FLDCGQGLAVRRQIKSFVLVQVVGNVADLSTRKGGIADLNFPFGGPGLMGNEKTPVIRGPAYLPDKSHIRAVAVRSRDCSERAGGDVDRLERLSVAAAIADDRDQLPVGRPIWGAIEPIRLFARGQNLFSAPVNIGDHK